MLSALFIVMEEVSKEHANYLVVNDASNTRSAVSVFYALRVKGNEGAERTWEEVGHPASHLPNETYQYNTAISRQLT